VHVPGVHDHVTARELGPEGVLQASRPLLPQLKAPQDGERRLGLQSAPQTALDPAAGVPADVRGLAGEQVQVDGARRLLARGGESWQVRRQHVELALGPEAPWPFRHFP
jgi:hypothetical protein